MCGLFIMVYYNVVHVYFQPSHIFSIDNNPDNLVDHHYNPDSPYYPQSQEQVKEVYTNLTFPAILFLFLLNWTIDIFSICQTQYLDSYNMYLFYRKNRVHAEDPPHDVRASASDPDAQTYYYDQNQTNSQG